MSKSKTGWGDNRREVKVTSEFECKHDFNIPFYKGDDKHKPIEFVTDKGNRVILKWDKEYKAYDSNNNYLGLGAVIPENLIKYIKKNY